jgi:hypothetical protein
MILLFEFELTPASLSDEQRAQFNKIGSGEPSRRERMINGFAARVGKDIFPNGGTAAPGRNADLYRCIGKLPQWLGLTRS